MNSDRRLSVRARLTGTLRLALIGVALGAAVGSAGCDRLLSAERRIERAAEEYEAGRYGAAMRDVKTALEAEPDNVRGRVLLARITLQVGDAEAARKELDRAIEAGADEASLRELHYDILLAQGRYQDALIAATVEEGLAPARRLYVMAAAQTALGQTDEAGRSLDEALALEPANRDLQILRARWLWSSGRLDESRELLDQLTQQDPGFAEAWLYKGRFALGNGDAQAALEAFQAAGKTAAAQLQFRDQLAVHAGLVESRLALGDAAGAENELQELDSKARDAAMTQFLRARIAFARGDYRAASAELQRALSRQPNFAAARLLLGAALFEQGSTEQAEAELSRLIADQPDNVEARKLLARILMARNDVAGARRVLANAPVTGVRDSGVDWLSGALLVYGGQTAEGIGLLEQASRQDPGNVSIKLDLVRAYLSAGRRAEASALLATVPAQQGGPRRRQLEVLTEVLGREPQAARAGVDRLVAENPADGELLAVAASWLFAAGDYGAARDVYAKAVATDPKAVAARLGLASALLYLGENARAEAELRKALELDPAEERTYVLLAGIALAGGDRQAAERWLEQAIGANPGAVEARLQLAELALAAKDTARMKSLAEQALSVTRTRPQTLNRVGQLLMRVPQYDEALTRFNEAAAAGFDDAGVNAALALLALGRSDEARARLESLASRRRDWAAPVAFLAGIDASQKRYDQALARVAAFERAGGSPAAADEIRGDILLASGKPKDAVAALEEAARAQPSAQLAIKLFRARVAAAVPSAEASLQEWLERNPSDVTVRIMLAEHHQRRGERKAAIMHYERALQFASNPAVMNNLAWLYYQTGDKRAVDLARRAHEAAPGVAEIADTYGWVLVEQGRAAEGLPVLEQAASARPDHPEIQYHYAAALARSGRKEDATRLLRDLLGRAPAFPSRGEAEALLKSLGG